MHCSKKIGFQIQNFSGPFLPFFVSSFIYLVSLSLGQYFLIEILCNFTLQ